jgi:hypothetical protein
MVNESRDRFLGGWGGGGTKDVKVLGWKVLLLSHSSRKHGSEVRVLKHPKNYITFLSFLKPRFG